MSFVMSAESSQILEEMYSDHHGWLFHWLRGKLNCPEQAADMMQDTFCRLFSFAGLNQVQEPRALLVTTASRLIIDAARRRKIEQKYLETWTYYHGELMEAPSAEELVILSDTLVAIARILDGLADKPREAFLLNRLEGLKHADIAERMGVSKSSVKQYIAAAMMHCYRVMAGAGMTQS